MTQSPPAELPMTIVQYAKPPQQNNSQNYEGKKHGASYFRRTELQAILDIYARQVAAGVWRDYAIDHQANQAFFSIYRSSFETPLYTIGKIRLKGHNRWLYTLHDRRKCLKSGGNLADILTKLASLPRLVQP